jgi:hypothetical protein
MSEEQGTLTKRVCDAFCELLKRNYVYMDGFPSSAPTPGIDRRSFSTKVKEFFQTVFQKKKGN